MCYKDLQQCLSEVRGMPQATFWFTSPFREWIGQSVLVVSWDEETTLREILHRLTEEYPGFRGKLVLQEERLDGVAAFILDGRLLSLGSPIPDGAKIDVVTPLVGGA
jgi:molybdopterin converting factor small subunit